jgi:hypothetical protein
MAALMRSRAAVSHFGAAVEGLGVGFSSAGCSLVSITEIDVGFSVMKIVSTSHKAESSGFPLGSRLNHS